MPTPGPDRSPERVVAAFAELADAEFADLPLYRRLARLCVDDPARCRALLHARAGQARPVLWLAAVHDLVLGGTEHPLAEWYPTRSDRPRSADDPALPDVLDDFVDIHHDDLVTICARRATQTNEVNRSAWWILLLHHPMLAGVEEVSLVELGASAGCNLCPDRYHLDAIGPAGSRRFGDPDAAVSLHTELRGDSLPGWASRGPRITGRVGIDLHPVRPDDAEDLRWLRACIWPEQTHRVERFDAAVAEVRRVRPDLVTGDAIDTLPTVCDGLDRRAPIVVINSWALTYVERARRSTIWDTLDRIGAGRELWWWSLEAPGAIEGIEPPEHLAGISPTSGTSVGAVTHWHRGERSTTVAGITHPHLQWCEPLG